VDHRWLPTEIEGDPRLVTWFLLYDVEVRLLRQRIGLALLLVAVILARQILVDRNALIRVLIRIVDYRDRTLISIFDDDVLWHLD